MSVCLLPLWDPERGWSVTTLQAGRMSLMCLNFHLVKLYFLLSFKLLLVVVVVVLSSLHILFPFFQVFGRVSWGFLSRVCICVCNWSPLQHEATTLSLLKIPWGECFFCIVIPWTSDTECWDFFLSTCKSQNNANNAKTISLECFLWSIFTCSGDLWQSFLDNFSFFFFFLFILNSVSQKWRNIFLFHRF